MDDRSVIAKRLKEARLRAGLSQKELGIKAGIDEFVSSARINQYERGKHQPDFSTCERLARALGIPTPYLYARDNALAAWIVAYGRLRPAARRHLLEAALAAEPHE